MYRRLCYIGIGFSLLASAISQTCYWPDGTDAGSAYKPCLNGKGVCCYNTDASHVDLCYANGFCYSLYFGHIYRGACTDQAFNSASGCASTCTNFNVGDAAVVSPCADYTNCCGTAENVTACCASGSGFTWVNATFVSEVQTTATGSIPSATGSVITVTTPIFATKSAIATATSTSTPESNKSNCTSQSNSLGAGLGVLLALALLACFVLGWLLSRSKRAASHKPASQVHGCEMREPERGWSRTEVPATHKAKEWPALVEVYELG